MAAERLDKVISGVFIAVIAFTVLAHGARELWSATIFQLLIVLLLLLWVIKCVLEKRVELKIPLTFFPLAAFLIFCFIQSISLTNGGEQRSAILSMDAEATRSSVKILFFLVAAHVIAANFFKARERIQTLFNFLTIFGLLVAVFGLLQYFTWDGNLYWFRPVANATTFGVIGPFFNHAHFAGFMNLLIPIPIALILTGGLQKSIPLFAFAAIMMAVAVVASLSRGGIISLSVGLIFLFGTGFYYTRRIRKNSDRVRTAQKQSFVRNSLSYLPGLGALVIIIGAVFFSAIWLGFHDPVIEQIKNNDLVSDHEKAATFEGSRGWIWRNSLSVFYANPVFGSGLGTYQIIFPKYADTDKIKEFNGFRSINTAHNDYLQVLTDTGLIGGIIAVWFILTVFYLAFRSLRSPDPFSAGIGMAISTGILTLMIHSIFDFNLQVISNSLLFLSLIAVLSQIPHQAVNRTFAEKVD